MGTQPSPERLPNLQHCSVHRNMTDHAKSTPDLKEWINKLLQTFPFESCHSPGSTSFSVSASFKGQTTQRHADIIIVQHITVDYAAVEGTQLSISDVLQSSVTSGSPVPASVVRQSPGSVIFQSLLPWFPIRIQCSWDSRELQISSPQGLQVPTVTWVFNVTSRGICSMCSASSEPEEFSVPEHAVLPLSHQKALLLQSILCLHFSEFSAPLSV